MASEIRVNKIENRSGLGTVTFADTGVDLAGIVTATTFSGSGASLTALPAANITGTLPAISAANLTNVPAANITGTLPALSAANLTSIPAANVTGTLPALTAANLTNIPAANLVGVCTAGLTRTGGFGKVLQYKVSKKTNTTSTSSQSYAEISSDFRITLTPTASDSTIIVTAYLVISNNNNANTVEMRRNTASDFTGTSTEVLPPDDNAANEDATGTYFGENHHMCPIPITVYETSGNTTARTYSPFWRIGGGTGYLNRISSSSDYQSVSTMTVTEIAA